MVQFGYVRFVSTAPPHDTGAVLLGDQSPTLSGGLGGWTEVDRPKRTSITEWQGRKPYRMSIPVLFDAYASNGAMEAGDRIENRIAALEAMATPLTQADKDPLGPPPIVRVEGAIPHNNLQWVIDSIDWGDSEWVVGAGPIEERVRQAATVSLIEYVAGPTFGIRSAAPGKPLLYTTKKGDTLKLIATKRLHAWRRWSEIRDLNPKLPHKRDPNYKIKPGTRIKVPAK